MKIRSKGIKGRGAAENPPNRFEKTEYIPLFEEKHNPPKIKTSFYKDDSKTIITYNQSPDLHFGASINPYRGCEHGCTYCYARPTHEYLGFSCGIDFETKIFVKENAPKLLKKELLSPKWKPQPIAMSGITDCYQPAERYYRITRKCLEVLCDFKNPVGIVTKNSLVTRDIDLLQELSTYNAAMVAISITTLDPKLCLNMEPRTSQPHMRLKTIEKLASSGIPTMILIAPVIPGLNDHEIPEIIKRASQSGALAANYSILRLPIFVKEVFLNWLERCYPEKKNKIINRIKALRKGTLNSNKFYERLCGDGIYAEHIKNIFDISCKRFGIKKRNISLSVKHFTRIHDEKQLKIFDNF